MSISWYLYRAEPGAGAMHTWEEDLTSPIATVDSIKTRLSELYPKLNWAIHAVEMGGKPYTFHSALGNHLQPDDEYVDLSFDADAEGYVRMIRARKASPKVVIAIMEKLGLNSVYQDQPGVMVDPYAFEGNWNPK